MHGGRGKTKLLKAVFSRNYSNSFILSPVVPLLEAEITFTKSFQIRKDIIPSLILSIEYCTVRAYENGAGLQKVQYKNPT